MGEQDLIQLSLVVRAFFFVVVFLWAGWLTWKSNPRKLRSVNALAVILIGIGLFNIFMMVQWILLFYF